MCGICGIATLRGPTAPGHDRQPRIAAMMERLRHRGSGESGTVASAGATFGTQRLAIRALADGQQPMVDLTSGVLAACNGEIDNHVELRRWLEGRGILVSQAA